MPRLRHAGLAAMLATFQISHHVESSGCRFVPLFGFTCHEREIHVCGIGALMSGRS